MSDFRMNNFNDDMRQFVFARTERIVLRETSPEYRQLSERFSELFDNLLSMLSEEGQDLLRELEDVVSHQALLAEAAVYNMAFSDGIRVVMQSLAGGVL